MRTLHLFAGAGGGLLADLILGHTPIAAVEWNRYACQILRMRAPEWFPELRVHEQDIREFDPSEYAGSVDIVAAGLPCPNWSSARWQRGTCVDGWSEVARCVAIIRPRFLFLECVAGFEREHERVARDLVAIDFRLGRPLLLDAASVGAPQSRIRYWAIARADSESESARAVDVEEVGELPPIEEVDPWSVDPGALRVVDGLADRVHRLKAIGNGQVPAQAALAWRILTA